MKLAQEVPGGVKGYAMVTDYCKIFRDHLDHFYTLSLLLTADHRKAEQCFVGGLEDCLQGNPVFREWAQAWATRTVIKNAIRMISPSTTETTGTSRTSEATEPSERYPSAVAITKLAPLERFVYVMSVLEKYSDRECSLLLDCTIHDIVDARARACETLAELAVLVGPQADLIECAPALR
jgi:hypothetical protein